MHEKDYLHWLMEQAGLEKDDGFGYETLCGILNGVSFCCCLEMDENRIDDAFKLRDEYCDEGGDAQEVAKEMGVYTCSVMELLVVFARKMRFEMLESRYDKDISDWFIELLCNLGIAKWTDMEIRQAGYDAAVEEISEACDIMMFRDYGHDGVGGLFPVSGKQYYQDCSEMLIQMNNYLVEKYHIF